ncbi:hypothetical protein pb186bvf_011018 [Paramecium bursaria]
MRTTRVKKSKQQPKLEIYDKFDEEKTTSKSPTQITIKDLCPEDKAKIGDLIRRLAEEQEQNEKLRLQLQDKEKEFKTQIKQIRQQSESARKSQKQTEQKFKESLDVIRKLQLQETLITQQLATAQVTKFDSFTQCEIEQKENLIQNEQPKTKKDDKPKSEILQLKQEIEEITHSLKNMQFGQGLEQFDGNSFQANKYSPPPKHQQQNRARKYEEDLQNRTNKNSIPRQKEKVLDKPQMQKQERYDKYLDYKFQSPSDKQNQNIPRESRKLDRELKFNNETQKQNNNIKVFQQEKSFQEKSNKKEQSIQTDFQTEDSKRPTIRFQDEYKALESKLSRNGFYQATQYSDQKQDTIESAQIAQSSSSDEDIDIASQLLKKKYERISNSIVGAEIQKSQVSNYTKKSMAQDSFINQELLAQTQNQAKYRTNTLSFNLTNEQTPQPSQPSVLLTSSQNSKKYKPGESQQFGSSIMQTPMQLSLQQQVKHSEQQGKILMQEQEPDDLDMIISNLNGRSFQKVKHPVVQNLVKEQFQDSSFTDKYKSQDQEPSDYQFQDNIDYQLNDNLQSNDSNSSKSSIPREEYQRLIDKYMNNNGEI